uniref:Secreted protein n=1 Tax=Macrostomum lignano TaxID=282301 RepID=A0A1I8FQN3_9PLAT
MVGSADAYRQRLIQLLIRLRLTSGEAFPTSGQACPASDRLVRLLVGLVRLLVGFVRLLVGLSASGRACPASGRACRASGRVLSGFWSGLSGFWSACPASGRVVASGRLVRLLVGLVGFWSACPASGRVCPASGRACPASASCLSVCPSLHSPLNRAVMNGGTSRRRDASGGCARSVSNATRRRHFFGLSSSAKRRLPRVARLRHLDDDDLPMVDADVDEDDELLQAAASANDSLGDSWSATVGKSTPCENRRRCAAPPTWRPWPLPRQLRGFADFTAAGRRGSSPRSGRADGDTASRRSRASNFWCALVSGAAEVRARAGCRTEQLAVGDAFGARRGLSNRAQTRQKTDRHRQGSGHRNACLLGCH